MGPLTGGLNRIPLASVGLARALTDDYLHTTPNTSPLLGDVEHEEEFEKSTSPRSGSRSVSSGKVIETRGGEIKGEGLC